MLDAGVLALAAWLVWRRADTLRLGGIGRGLLFGLLPGRRWCEWESEYVVFHLRPAVALR